MADGPLPPLDRPETFWLVSFLYPLRGAECLGVTAILASIFWVFFLLVPEYCIGIMQDAASMSASLMGMLFVVIAAVPIVLMAPFVLSYGLQYLGRVLVFSAMGETTPPRMPDRNFDGFFNGLSPWFVWLVLGLGVGLLPALGSISSSGPEARFPWIPLALLLAGVPYILAALMMSFLHDNRLAPSPWGVLIGLFRLGPAFFGLCVLIAIAFALALGTFGLALLLRPNFYWLYLALGLGCWIIVLWITIVVMRLLGTYYFHHKDNLHWHQAHPRWGVAWRL